MNQKDKDLLLKDLCARLPYHVRCKIWLKDGTTEEGPLDLQHNYGDVLRDVFFYHDKIKDIKPYLRPRSEIANLISAKEFTQLSGIDLIDWYNANHIDYRTDDEGKTMIEKGLALIALEGMYD